MSTRANFDDALAAVRADAEARDTELRRQLHEAADDLERLVGVLLDAVRELAGAVESTPLLEHAVSARQALTADRGASGGRPLAR
jgi:hypothetical protein